MSVSFEYTVTEKTLRTYKSKKQKFFCSESNGSQGWLPLQVKIETLGSIFSQETRKGLLATSQTKNIFASCFYSVNGYQCKFF